MVCFSALRIGKGLTRIGVRKGEGGKQMSPIRIRQLILEMAKRAGVGHIGSALSIADITAALYGDVIRIVHPDDPN